MTTKNCLALALALGGVFATSVQADPANRLPKFQSSVADDTLGPAILGARVNSDGSLFTSNGATSSNLISSFTGNYEVFFNRNVSGCIYAVSPLTLRFVYDVQPRSGSSNAVFVHFQDTSGTDTNVAFYLTVTCVR